jgi:hypothetical protein
MDCDGTIQYTFRKLFQLFYGRWIRTAEGEGYRRKRHQLVTDVQLRTDGGLDYSFSNEDHQWQDEGCILDLLRDMLYVRMRRIVKS